MQLAVTPSNKRILTDAQIDNVLDGINENIIVDKQFFLQPKNKIRQYIWSEKYCRYVIENLTDEGDMVIDPFAGVGIVLSTSKKLNRHYWGAEISNEYYNEGFKNIYE